MRRTSLLLPLLSAMVSFAADPPKKIFPLAYDQHDYSNGLRLITIPTDYPNVVSVFIVVQTGSRNEVEPGRSGFAHLFEHMMFRGTKEFPPEKYQNTLKSMGAASNAFTSDDLTAYHTTFSKEDLEAVMRMESDRFAHLDYSPDVFKTESLAVLGEYNKNSAAPTSKLFEVLRDTAYDQHTYKHTTMGFLKRHSGHAQPVRIQPSPSFDRYYRPEYTTIIVAGDVTAAGTSRRPSSRSTGAQWKRGELSGRHPHRSRPPERPRAPTRWFGPLRLYPGWRWLVSKEPAYSDTENDQARP